MMRGRVRAGLAIVGIVVETATPVSTQGLDAQRTAALEALVARGAKALAEGQVEQARAAWTLAVAFRARRQGNPGAA